jgi:hypothetical protein
MTAIPDFGLLLGGALMVTVGCADDPRPGRRATAIDVAGTWLEERDDALSGATARVDNEDGIVDVVLTLRDRTVGPSEAAVLARLPSSTDRATLVERLTLGAGRDLVREETDGGENVSFDGGRTTTVQVRSAPIPIAASSPSAREATLGFALRLDGDDTRLEGHLMVLVSEVVPRVGDVDGFARETNRIDVPLRLIRLED